MLVVPGEFAFIHLQRTGGTSISDLLRERFGGVLDEVGTKHSNKKQEWKLIDDWDDLFSFAFVRNTWDRLYSWHSFVMQRGSDFQNGWQKYIQNNYPKFDDFIRSMSDHGFRERKDFGQLSKLTNGDGRIVVTRIGRYEDYARELVDIFTNDLKSPIEPDQVPWKNRVVHDHYSRHYTSETREIVADLFGEEIDRFGFQFEEWKGY